MDARHRTQSNHGANPCVPYIAVVVKIYLAYTSIIVSPHLWQGDGITRAAKSGNIGAWLSLVEHPIWDREAVSPNLTAPTVGESPTPYGRKPRLL